jgi:aryl sulfotransferase
MKTWWEARHLPNVLFVHFSDLKKDLKGQMRRIAEFIGAPVDESKFDAQVRACTFEAMKGNAAAVAPLGGAMWKGGADTFINKGTNGRWKEVLTKAQVEAYEKAAEARLGKECAKWLARGGDARKQGGCVVS